MSTGTAISDGTGPKAYGDIFPPDEAWLATQPREEILLPELPIVDSHHHLWNIGGQPYGLTEFLQDASTGHNIVSSVYVECTFHYRTEGPEELRPIGETEYVEAATATRPTSGTVVAAGILGFADLELGAKAEAVLDAHLEAGRGRFRGIRYATHWDASPEIQNGRGYVRPGLLADATVAEGARKLAERGLSLDALVFHPQLDDVGRLADAVPGLTIVLNHCGFPLGYGPYEGHDRDNFTRWQTKLRDVAQRPNVYVKLGGLLSRTAAYDYLTASVPATSEVLARAWQPWLDATISAFGPDRCMFESNFPVEKMGTGYATLWNAFKRATLAYSPDERTQLFSATAQRVYGI